MIDAGTVVQVVMRGLADGSCRVSALVTRDGYTDPNESLSATRNSFNAAFGLLGGWSVNRGLLDVPPAPPVLPDEDAPAQATPEQCSYCLKPLDGPHATCSQCDQRWHLTDCARAMLGSAAPTEPGPFDCRFCDPSDEDAA